MIANDACFCTVLPGVEKPVEADIFCHECNGSGKLEKPVSGLFDRLKRINRRETIVKV